jgi:endonuclease/exonuclease/phosphatase family metal-dependent hydrolase
MKIVTLNTWGTDGPFEKRWEALLEELSQINPEIICLQEVFDPELIERIQKTFGFMNVLMSLRSGLALMTKCELASEKTFPYETQSPTESYLREVILAELKTVTGKFLITNTHLAWKSEDDQIRIGQVKELIAAVENETSGIVLAGDFNDIPTSPAMQELKHSGYRDVYEMLHPRKDAWTWDNRNPFIQTHSTQFPDRRIDFLIVDETFIKKNKLKKCELAFHHPNAKGIYPSDHYGLVAEF